MSFFSVAVAVVVVQPDFLHVVISLSALSLLCSKLFTLHLSIQFDIWILIRQDALNLGI